MENSNLLEERKQKLFAFFKEKYTWVTYVVLAAIVWLAVYIRTIPMQINPQTGKPWLWDIGRDTWTLGPDLDPFIFFRWSKELATQGYISAVDHLRYIPYYFDTSLELKWVSYTTIAVYKFLNLFSHTSIEYAAVVMPVFMFAFTVIVFFLFARRLFLENMGNMKANIIALISSLFFVLIPSLLPRTVAGIPGKESVAFFYMFLAFYLFVCAWKAKTPTKMYILGLLTALATALMAYTWGGYVYIFVTFGLVMLLAFILGQATKDKIILYTIWLVGSFIIMYPVVLERYPITFFFTSVLTLFPILVLGLMLFHALIFNTRVSKIFDAPFFTSNNFFKRTPKPLLSIIYFFVLGIILVSITPHLGPGFLISKSQDALRPIIAPVSDRMGVTVAENRMPYYAEWAGSFGPTISDFFKIITFNIISIPTSVSQNLSVFYVFFWLFFIGSVYLLFIYLKDFAFRERAAITVAYTIFLFCLVFSRYSATSTFNGVNGISIFVYALGVIALVGTFGYYYFKAHENGELAKMHNLDFGILFLFVFFFFCVVSARGSVRTVMFLVPAAAIIVGYFNVVIFDELKKFTDKTGRYILVAFIIVLLLATLGSAFYFYQGAVGTAHAYVPDDYTHEWQLAMAWVRENTSTSAVFAHWWDYGYWVQAIGERATVLDGGNYYGYWDYLMGRVLAGSNETFNLDFLYSHNVTHLLIDPTDIGKYGAFSSIGSNNDCDLRSYIPTLSRDDRQARETKNSTIFVYPGGFGLDGDVYYSINGTKVAKPLPAGSAGILGFTVELDAKGEIVNQPTAIFYYQGKQLPLPLRYAYFNKKLTDFGSGVDAGVFGVATVTGQSIVKNGAILYLSPRVIHSQVAQLYLFGQNDSNYTLVHSQDFPAIAQIKESYGFDEDFLVYGEFRGPIKIWQVNYPSTVQFNEQYLSKDYPESLRNAC